MTELTSKQRKVLLRYLSGEEIESIAESAKGLKVGLIKKWLYDLDTRSRLALERELRLTAICDIERHINRMTREMSTCTTPFDLRNLTVAYGVLVDKRTKINEEIQRIEAQIVTTKRVRASHNIKVRDDYDVDED